MKIINKTASVLYNHDVSVNVAGTEKTLFFMKDSQNITEADIMNYFLKNIVAIDTDKKTRSFLLYTRGQQQGLLDFFIELKMLETDELLPHRLEYNNCLPLLKTLLDR